jgi:cyclopropane fatty-acyl-phospholipid synthase-like methyltransferase
MNGQLPVHLGGHMNITHLDLGSLLYVQEKYNVQTMYDVGCGPGGMVELAIQLGIKCKGIDGDFTYPYPQLIKDNLILHDFTKSDLIVEPADFAWSCEFLEHVEERYMDNYFSVFKQCKRVICTFATNDRGWHHVNVKDQSYWDNQFKERGFLKDEKETQYIRENSSMQREFMRNTGTMYVNDSL